MNEMQMEARLEAIEITLAALVRANPSAAQQLEKIAIGLDAAPVPVSDRHLELVAAEVRQFAKGAPGIRWSDGPAPTP